MSRSGRRQLLHRPKYFIALVERAGNLRQVGTQLFFQGCLSLPQLGRKVFELTGQRVDFARGHPLRGLHVLQLLAVPVNPRLQDEDSSDEPGDIIGASG